MPSLSYNSAADSPNCWHILDVGSVWLKEFASALGTMVPTYNWVPDIRNFGHWERWEREHDVVNPALKMIAFPLQRGYGRFPIAPLLAPERAMVSRLLRRSRTPQNATLVLTSPFYAPVAELWPGHVVYYLTDLTKEYAGMNPAQVTGLDRRMCAVADLVCPNSRRIADYLCREAGCAPEKIVVVPNATRASNVLSQPLFHPAQAPAALAGSPRPIVGVIGNLAGNIDWVLLADAVARARDITWAFVGPTSMDIPDKEHQQLRQHLMQMGGRVRFLGAKPYNELAQYARSFDVALIPYLKKEPTISGSATRFYEHLAACRPILASRAHAELLTKEPLLKLVSSGEEIAAQLNTLRDRGFNDGYEELRWTTSRNETWHARAETVAAAAEARGFGAAQSRAESLHRIA